MSVIVPDQVLDSLGDILGNDSKPMAMRMRAVFTLKACAKDNINALNNLKKGFASKSELLRHEIAYLKNTFC